MNFNNPATDQSVIVLWGAQPTAVYSEDAKGILHLVNADPPYTFYIDLREPDGEFGVWHGTDLTQALTEAVLCAAEWKLPLVNEIVSPPSQTYM